MSDNCPRCCHTEHRPAPHYESPYVNYRCSVCGHRWTTGYDPDVYEITNDTLPAHWADP
jgi:transposase-like protein